jgi:hypothetical protein
MSADRPRAPEEPPARQPGAGEAPSEEELRAAYEAELSRLTSADVIAQTVVSLLNLGARRLGPVGDPTTAGAGGAPEAGDASGVGAQRDLEQARDAIDAVRALLEILERRMPEGLRPLRDALAQLQMAYAREVQPVAGAAASEGQGTGAKGGPASRAGGAESPEAHARDAPPGEGKPGEPGPAQKSGRLWVPGS